MSVRARPQRAEGVHRSGRSGSLWSVLIGLGLPATAIIVVVPIISGVRASVAGIPLVYFWIFLWFPLTFGCLAVSWYVFDRPRYRELEQGEGA
ncbi:MAG TPA: hypothetical protein VKV33_11455 [Streptosporangiaceae bacterium]|nr:hypothetical protein [Streptosporangiaceae bacterium]